VHVGRSLLTFALLALGACVAESEPAKAPVKAPPALDAARAGRPALVSLWATWCEACATEFDALNRLDAVARERHAVVVGIAVGEDASKVAAFVRAHGLRYAQLVDEDFALADALGARRVPTTLVLDHTGRVVFRGSALDARALAALTAAEGD